jgi:hypothetical protein
LTNCRAAGQTLRQIWFKSSPAILERALELSDNLRGPLSVSIVCIRDEQLSRATSHGNGSCSEFSYLHKQQAYRLLGYVYTGVSSMPAARVFETAWSYNFNILLATAALGMVISMLVGRKRPSRRCVAPG